MAHLMVSLCHCSFGSNTRGKSSALEGHQHTVSAQKALQGSEKETRKLLGKTEVNSVSRRWVIDLPEEHLSAPPNISLLATCTYPTQVGRSCKYLRNPCDPLKTAYYSFVENHRNISDRSVVVISAER